MHSYLKHHKSGLEHPLQLILTLAVGPIIGDEDVHVVGGAVPWRAGTVVAAVCVVAGGMLPTNVFGSEQTLIFI